MMVLMKHWMAFVLFFFFLYDAQAEGTGYVKNSAISDSVWEQLQPYFLPVDHPIKAKLDAIFQKSRPIENYESMRAAKFSCRDRGNRIIVAKHSKLKGFLVKTFLDTHEVIDEWRVWVRRIQGVHQIQESIDRHRYGDLFKTPKKWIYPICSCDAQIDAPYPKYFILVVEDMRIYGYLKNSAKFFHLMNKKRMEALFNILTENRLIDSCFIDNIPFCKDGRMAFIDTEHFNVYDKRMRYPLLTSKFSPNMQTYWNHLIQQSGL